MKGIDVGIQESPADVLVREAIRDGMRSHDPMQVLPSKETVYRLFRGDGWVGDFHKDEDTGWTWTGVFVREGSSVAVTCMVDRSAVVERLVAFDITIPAKV